MRISGDAFVIGILIFSLASCEIADKLSTPRDIQCLQAGGNWRPGGMSPGYCERKAP